MNQPLIFDIALGYRKPVNIRNEKIACPFCDTSHLTDILDRNGTMIWLKNKYPVLQDTWPTVIIETDDCHGEFSTYDPHQAAAIISFSMDKWIETMKDRRFKSVLYFKNYGPLSGGSIRHPHSQIIGLETYDYCEDIKPYHFDGWLLKEDDTIKITLSKHPLIGFFEYNLQFPHSVNRSKLSRRMQQITKYIISTMKSYTKSYNFFFYNLHDDYYYAKIIPRYVTTPLFIGYKIPQIGCESRVATIQEELKAYWDL